MPRTVAVITGASSGIGMEFARQLAPTHDLMLIARREKPLQQLAAELRSTHGARVDVLPADLCVAGHVERVVGAMSRLTDLGLLVNNAGFGARGPFWTADIDGIDAMHRLHVTAVLRLSHAALGIMVARDRGTLINVASVAAFGQRAGSAAYGASKSWLVAFTEGLHLDLKRAGSTVTVQALCPGFTYSGFHDVMGEDRRRLAPAAFWLTAEAVVRASLRGVTRRDLVVIPGWRYALLVAILRSLPPWLKLRLEAAAARPSARAPAG